MKNKFLKLIGHIYSSDKTHRFKWGEFTWHPKSLGLSLRYCNFGGCETHDLIIIEPLFFSLYIYMSDEYDLEYDDEGWDYGFYVYDWTDLNLCWNKYRKNWGIPYRSCDWVSTEVMDLDRNVVFVENLENRKSSWDERYEIQNKIKVDFPYTYQPKFGEVQYTTAKVHVSRMKWVRKWWPFKKLERTSIDVTFDPSIGDDNDGWKGGCISCGWELRDDETPEQSLRRMELERRFER